MLINHVKTFVINFLVASLMVGNLLYSARGTAVGRNCSCYMFRSSEALEWAASRRECERTGGDLVSMETRNEWEFIRDKIKKIDKKGNEWHIGLKKDSGWNWVSGVPLNTTCETKLGQTIKGCWPWQPTEPNNDRGRATVALMAKEHPDDSYGLFNDVVAEAKKIFICELKAGNCTKVTPRWCPKAVTVSAKPDLATSTHKVTEFTENEYRFSTSIKAVKTTEESIPVKASTKIFEELLPSDKKTQASTSRSETPTSVYDEKIDYSTHTYIHTTKINESEQPGADNNRSSNSTIIIVLAAGISVLVIATTILVIIILCRRRSQKKQIQELSNGGLALTTDGQQPPAEGLYATVDKSKKNNKGKKPAELVYADLTLSRGNGKNEVVKPEPYVPTVYADIRSAQAPAPANQEEAAAQNQEAEDPTYAGIV